MANRKAKSRKQLRQTTRKIRQKISKTNIEETIFKMTESANELQSFGNNREAVKLLKIIDSLCDKHEIIFPDEAVALNIHLDEQFGTNVLQSKI